MVTPLFLFALRPHRQCFADYSRRTVTWLYDSVDKQHDAKRKNFINAVGNVDFVGVAPREYLLLDIKFHVSPLSFLLRCLALHGAHRPRTGVLNAGGGNSSSTAECGGEGRHGGNCSRVAFLRLFNIGPLSYLTCFYDTVKSYLPRSIPICLTGML